MNLINHAAISNKTQADGVQAVSLTIHEASLLHQLQLSIGRYLVFTSGGTSELVAGITLTGAISGATARLGVVTVGAGSWEAGTAAGTLILYDQVGTFVAENLDWGTQLNVLTIAGDSSLPSAGTLTVGVKNPGSRGLCRSHTYNRHGQTDLTFISFQVLLPNIRVTPTAFYRCKIHILLILSVEFIS